MAHNMIYHGECWLCTWKVHMCICVLLLLCELFSKYQLSQVDWSLMILSLLVINFWEGRFEITNYNWILSVVVLYDPLRYESWYSTEYMWGYASDNDSRKRTVKIQVSSSCFSIFFFYEEKSYLSETQLEHSCSLPPCSQHLLQEPYFLVPISCWTVYLHTTEIFMGSNLQPLAYGTMLQPTEVPCQGTPYSSFKCFQMLYLAGVCQRNLHHIID